MKRVDRGLLVVLLGVGLFGVTMVASAALAPSLASGTDNGTETLLGSQAWGISWGEPWHENGQVIGLTGSEVAWQVDDAGSYFEVERAPDGTILAAFADPGRSDCGPYPSPCARTGYQRIDPDSREVIEEYSFPVRSMTNSEVHAVEPLGGGKVALLDMERERLLLVADGEVTWQWNASSFYTPPEHPTRRDWLHLNDVNYVGTEQFLISVRNANQLLVVERGKGVVEVINEDRTDADDGSCLRGGQLVPGADGDVRCGDPDVLNHQHNPQWLGDGAVLVADSGNNRVVELHRTRSGSWRLAWAVSRVGDLPFSWPRDADRLPNGHTLITDTYNGRIVEITENGTVTWSMATDRTPYEADRVPVGESIGVPLYGNVSRVDDVHRGFPVLSTITVGVRAVFPDLPFWIGDLQVLAGLASLVLVIGGLVDWVRH